MEKKKIKKVRMVLGISAIVFGVFGVIPLTILALLNDDENDIRMVLFFVFAIVFICSFLVMISTGIYLSVKQLTPAFNYQKDKESRNDFNLRIYACKNVRYIHKVLFDSRGRKRVDHDYFDNLIFHNYPYDYIEKNFRRNDLKRIINLFEIIDSRLIENTLFFEAKTIYGFVYVYINTEIKEYGIIKLKESEAKRISDINSAKERIVFKNGRIIEEMDKIFDEVESDNRIIKEKYDDSFSVIDVMIKISEIID